MGSSGQPRFSPPPNCVLDVGLWFAAFCAGLLPKHKLWPSLLGFQALMRLGSAWLGYLSALSLPTQHGRSRADQADNLLRRNRTRDLGASWETPPCSMSAAWLGPLWL